MISKLAAEILKSEAPLGVPTKIVAIDGAGGAGKSTLAGKLSSELDNCPIVHTDDFATWDVPLLWYPRMIEQVLEPLKQNRTARYQKFDWNVKQLGEWLEVSAGGIVILEGVSSARKEFRPYLSFSIFVQTPPELRMKRGLERDGESARDQWVIWRKQEDAHFASDATKNFVDVIVSGDPPAPLICE